MELEIAQVDWEEMTSVFVSALDRLVVQLAGRTAARKELEAELSASPMRRCSRHDKRHTQRQLAG